MWYTKQIIVILNKCTNKKYSTWYKGYLFGDTCMDLSYTIINYTGYGVER